MGKIKKIFVKIKNKFFKFNQNSNSIYKKYIKQFESFLNNNFNVTYNSYIIKRESDNILTVLIWCSSNYLSIDCFKYMKEYQDKINLVFLFDKNSYTGGVKKILSEYKAEYYVFSNEMSIAERIEIAILNIKTEYCVLFSMLDKINKRSFYNEFLQIINEQDLDCFTVIDEFPSIIPDFNLSKFSGHFFKTKILQDYLVNNELPKITFGLTQYLQQHVFTEIKKIVRIKQCFIIDYAKNLSIQEIAFLYRDTLKCKEIIEIQELIKLHMEEVHFLLGIKSSIELKRFLLASTCILLSQFDDKFTVEQFENLKMKYSALFNFDFQPKNEDVQFIVNTILEKFISINNNKISIIETAYMEDLRNEFLLELQKKYVVKYITKPQYYDYHYFNCLVIRSQIQDSKLVITSNVLDNIMKKGKTTISLWHGLGMLKKIQPINIKRYLLDYVVASSQECIASWANIFNLSNDKVLPLGNVHTDILFDYDYNVLNDSKIRMKYNIPNDAFVAFFAPTFRNSSEGKKYNFGLNINLLSKKLEEKNIYIIVKKHHVFQHEKNDKYEDKTGLVTSENQYFIVDQEFSFNELLCVANCFITDYSSGMFYAVLRDLPLVLYAPDYEEYKATNGFLIDYLKDIPASYVLEADEDKLITAIINSKQLTNYEDYEKFKEKHVGACNGKSTEKIIKVIDDFMKK